MLAATVPFTVSCRSHEVRPGLTDRAIVLSTGLSGRAALLSVFSRKPLKESPKVRQSSASTSIRAGGVSLRFRSLKRNLILEEIRIA